MKISLIKEYNSDHLEDQIVCLHDFDNKDLMELRNAFLTVCDGQVVILSEQRYIEDSDCRLILSLSVDNEGLKELSVNLYNCFLSKSEYQRIVNEIGSFAQNGYDENTYLWLYDINTPIDFLLSRNCKW